MKAHSSASKIFRDVEIEMAALQFVRKVSDYRTPSRKNQFAFEQAVEEIAAATKKLMVALTSTQPHNCPAEH